MNKQNSSTSPSKTIARLSILSIALTLAACGGGGGSGGSSAPIASTPTVTPSNTIVTSVPDSTYEVGSREDVAYKRLNAERKHCGFGLLAQNKYLDIAAAAHAKYSATTFEFGHFETPGKPDFYGVDVDARFARAGYNKENTSGLAYPTGEAGEFDSFGDFTPVQTGNHAIRRILAAPYHANTLLGGYMDVGVGFAKWDIFYANFASQSMELIQKTSELRTYPCEGTTGTMTNVLGETPTPFPGHPDQTWGQPIMVYGSAGLKISSASITGPKGSIPIRTIYGTGQTTDPEGGFGGQNSLDRAVVIPTAVLTTNTTYSVVIKGVDNGAAFDRSFNFATGSL